MATLNKWPMLFNLVSQTKKTIVIFFQPGRLVQEDIQQVKV